MTGGQMAQGGQGQVHGRGMHEQVRARTGHGLFQGLAEMFRGLAGGLLQAGEEFPDGGVFFQHAGEGLGLVHKVAAQHAHGQFGMFRTTEGIEWLLELGEVELKLLVMLHLWSDDDGSVSLSPIRREFVVRKLRTSGRTLRRSLVGLSEKGALLRLSKDDFVVNPSTFFKGGSKELKNKIKNYNGLRSSLGRAGRERRFEDEPGDKV